MAMHIGNRLIKSVHVIDDDPEVRSSYCENLEDMDLTPVEVKAVRDVNELVASLDKDHDGVICDYQLTSGRYSMVNGGVLASEFYKSSVPVILCTSYHPMTRLAGEFREHIPVVVHPDDLNKKIVEHAFTLCIRERQGLYSDARKPCRTMIRIEGLEAFGEELHLSVHIPAWRSEGIVVEVKMSDFPIFANARAAIDDDGCFRASAEINLGATGPVDLYFRGWRAL